MELAQSLQQALERVASAGRVEVRENGAWLAALEGFAYEVRAQNGSAMLHLWAAQRTQVRRVMRIVSAGPERVALEVARLGRTRPAKLEFIATRKSPTPARVIREQFRGRFQEILAEQFPDDVVASLTVAPDLEHSLSGSYVRGLVRNASASWAVLGTSPSESLATCDGLLTFGLIWLDRARQSPRGESVHGLRLFLPEGTGRAVAHRIAALSPATPVEL